MTPNELIAIACPKIRDLGWGYYFTPETSAAGAAIGLDAFRFYFLGRGGVLGDVESQVVAAAFGYFNPGVVADMWTSGQEKTTLTPRQCGAAYLECAAVHGRQHFATIDGLEAFNAAAEAVMAAADPTALMLYAAAAAEPLADDVPGRAMQLVSHLRELRGSAHLLAVRAVGLSAPLAHAISRPNDLEMFGWTADAVGAPTDEQRAALVEAELMTDRLVLGAYAALDDAQGDALLAGLAAIEKAAAG